MSRTRCLAGNDGHTRSVHCCSRGSQRCRMRCWDWLRSFAWNFTDQKRPRSNWTIWWRQIGSSRLRKCWSFKATLTWNKMRARTWTLPWSTISARFRFSPTTLSCCWRWEGATTRNETTMKLFNSTRKLCLRTPKILRLCSNWAGLTSELDRRRKVSCRWGDRSAEVRLIFTTRSSLLRFWCVKTMLSNKRKQLRFSRKLWRCSRTALMRWSYWQGLTSGWTIFRRLANTTKWLLALKTVKVCQGTSTMACF